MEIIKKLFNNEDKQYSKDQLREFSNELWREVMQDYQIEQKNSDYIKQACLQFQNQFINEPSITLAQANQSFKSMIANLYTGEHTRPEEIEKENYEYVKDIIDSFNRNGNYSEDLISHINKKQAARLKVIEEFSKTFKTEVLKWIQSFPNDVDNYPLLESGNVNAKPMKGKTIFTKMKDFARQAGYVAFNASGNLTASQRIKFTQLIKEIHKTASEDERGGVILKFIEKFNKQYSIIENLEQNANINTDYLLGTFKKNGSSISFEPQKAVTSVQIQGNQQPNSHTPPNSEQQNSTMQMESGSSFNRSVFDN